MGSTTTKTDEIRRLNDALRTGQSSDGIILATAGIQGDGSEVVERAMAAVQAFAAFDPDNDPHEEHDFGAVDVDTERLFFKADYFDLSMTGHSPDPAEPDATKRVLTIMLASEY